MSTDTTDTDERSVVTIDHSPTSVSKYVAVVAAIVAVAFGGIGAALGILFGVLGFALLAGSLFALESRAAVTTGVATIFVGIVVSGLFGAPAELLIPATVALLVAWDAGQRSIVLGEQIGDGGRTAKLEAYHVFVTGAVGLLGGILAYLVYLVSIDGVVAAAVLFILIGALLLAWAGRR